MRRSVSLLILLFAMGPDTHAWAQKPTPLTIYIGPQTRDGFIDVDQGVLDSIKDVTKELRKDKTLRIVGKPEDATLTLLILSRRSGDGANGVAVPIGGILAFGSINARAIDAILRVGSYEKRITAEDRENGTWTHAARALVKDVRAWVAANRAQLPQ